VTRFARFTELAIALLAAISVAVAYASTVSDPGTNPPSLRATASSRVAPLVDAEKSRRAIAAYGKSLALLCRSLQGGSAVRLTRLKEAGFESDADASTLCASPVPRPIPLASGALLTAGADEILLQVPNGRTAAAGDQTLAILRDEGAGYRLVRHILSGRRFEARLRLTTPGGRDILLLCRQDGNMGLYPSTCGLLGQGEFGASAPNSAADDKNELHLIRVTTCGRADSVILGDSPCAPIVCWSSSSWRDWSWSRTVPTRLRAASSAARESARRKSGSSSPTRWSERACAESRPRLLRSRPSCRDIKLEERY
jgi:hypothetical protein